MKKVFMTFSLIGVIFVSTVLLAGVTLRYYNKDSSNLTFDAKICGSSTTVTFGSSRTSSVTIQGCSKATIFTKCGKVEVNDGDNIEIKDGCIKVK